MLNESHLDDDITHKASLDFFQVINIFKLKSWPLKCPFNLLKQGASICKLPTTDFGAMAICYLPLLCGMSILDDSSLGLVLNDNEAGVSLPTCDDVHQTLVGLPLLNLQLPLLCSDDIFRSRKLALKLQKVSFFSGYIVTQLPL